MNHVIWFFDHFSQNFHKFQLGDHFVKFHLNSISQVRPSEQWPEVTSESDGWEALSCLCHSHNNERKQIGKGRQLLIIMTSSHATHSSQSTRFMD